MTQDTSVPILPNVLSCANGPGATRALHASMIASECMRLGNPGTAFQSLLITFGARSIILQTTPGVTHLEVTIKRMPGMWEDIQPPGRAQRKSHWLILLCSSSSLTPMRSHSVIVRSHQTGNCITCLTLCCFSTVRSDGGADCRHATEAAHIAQRLSPPEDDWENASNSTERSDRAPRRSPQRTSAS